MNKFFKLIALQIMLLISLSACNTIHGIGQDLEKAGEAVQKSTK